MRHAWVLVALVAAMMALTSACRHTEIVVVTATPGPPPTPTQTYNQWLGGQIALAMCRDPDHILTYHNERRSPPYQANFVCESPTSIPDAAATQVAATVTAASPPTRPPRATLTPDEAAACNTAPDAGPGIHPDTMADSTADQADARLAFNAYTYPLSTGVNKLRTCRG